MKTIFKQVEKLGLILILIVGIGTMANAQVKTVLKTSDLQKGITDQITHNYAGYAIKDAYKINHNKVITYQVDVVKDNKIMCLTYNDKGKFLKAYEPKNKTKSLHKTTAMIDKSHAKK